MERTCKFANWKCRSQWVDRTFWKRHWEQKTGSTGSSKSSEQPNESYRELFKNIYVENKATLAGCRRPSDGHVFRPLDDDFFNPFMPLIPRPFNPAGGCIPPRPSRPDPDAPPSLHNQPEPIHPLYPNWDPSSNPYQPRQPWNPLDPFGRGGEGNPLDPFSAAI